jgi:hypothetical protein
LPSDEIEEESHSMKEKLLPRGMGTSLVTFFIESLLFEEDREPQSEAGDLNHETNN